MSELTADVETIDDEEVPETYTTETAPAADAAYLHTASPSLWSSGAAFPSRPGAT